MTYLILAIIFSSSIAVTFKLFAKYKINTLHAIVVNYVVCSAVGLLIFGVPVSEIPHLVAQPWFHLSIILGFVFILGFFVVAKCIEHFGISLTVIMQKISLVITVLYTIWIFGEPAGWVKWTGLAIAVAAIILVNIRPGQISRIKAITPWLLLLPFITFSLNGIIDITMYYVKASSPQMSDEGPFTTIIFVMAGILGLIILGIKQLMHRYTFHWKNILAGIVLGVPNFMTIYCVMMSLNTGWGGSIIFPIYNIGVILLSTTFGIFAFKEEMKWYNYVGMALAILSIIMITNLAIS